MIPLKVSKTAIMTRVMSVADQDKALKITRNRINRKEAADLV